MCLLQYGQSDQLVKARSYAMPRKTRGEKGHQRCSSVESEEPLDEARSLASWLQLPRESLVLKCNTHNLSTRGKKAELAARLKSFFEENHHQDQDTSMADNNSPSSIPNPTQAISVPAASPIIQSIMPGIAELITKHLSQLPASTFQSQPGSSKDSNYSSQPCNKDGANPGQERTSSGKEKCNARLKRAHRERSHSPSPVAKHPRSKPASKSASKRSPSLSSLESRLAQNVLAARRDRKTRSPAGTTDHHTLHLPIRHFPILLLPANTVILLGLSQDIVSAPRQKDPPQYL